MKRTNLNLVIDCVAFAALLMLLSTGLVLEFQLPPGSGDRVPIGSGHGAWTHPVVTLWGWTRHEWGAVHYWGALALCGVLAAHVLLHWKWIVSVIGGKPSNASGFRLGIGAVGLAFFGLLCAAPLMSASRTLPRNELSSSPPAVEGTPSTVDAKRASHDDDFQALRGSMTFRQIAEASKISPDDVMKTLGFTAAADADKRAGPFLRRHNLTMSDLRNALRRLESSEPPAD
jgi:hypothetical protein